jgi:diguanylate cyclase (GGDEF)-like protein
LERAVRRTTRHGLARVLLGHWSAGARGDQGWGPRALPGLARALAFIVTCLYLGWAVLAAAHFTFRAHGLLLFAALVGCAVMTAGLSRRSSHDGAARDVYTVWELPVAIHLPLLYALVVPVVRLAATHRLSQEPPAYRQKLAAVAAGLGYGCAFWVFRAVLPAESHHREVLLRHAYWWLLAAACGALAQWAVRRLLLVLVDWAADPAAGLRGARLGRDPLQDDATELCVAVLVALAVQVSPFALLVACPLGRLLQRSYRHAQLLYDARADAKTGLLNAAAWEAEATAEVNRAVRTGSPLAVALLDLDRFKLINDTYGHLTGDRVLKQIATSMTEVLRDYDLAGRFGGEEFAMLLPQTRAVDALRIAERVRAHIADLPVDAGEAAAERVRVTVSIGVAALDAGSHRELADLLAAADAALYRAKASGRDQVQMISTSRGLSAAQPPPGGGMFGGRPGCSAGGGRDAPGTQAAGVDAVRSSTAATSALAV